MDYINQTIHGDNLEVMPLIPDKSIDLIIADPPYNINKADWDKIPNYIEWLGNRLLEMQRVLKDNGSFYLFHNDFLQMVEIQNWINKNSRFVFKSLITIDKLDNTYIKDRYGSQEHFRNYLNLSEYILFYTFQDETGLNKILPLCFTPYLNYMTEEKENIKWSIKDFNNFLNYQSIASHWFWQDKEKTKQPQPRFISKEDYKRLQKTGCFKREYESLRQEYESLRYTFNQKNGLKNIWAYHFRKDKQYKHPTQKPLKLIKDIILNSSNEGDIVLIPFVGTGTDVVACKELKRNYIGIENKEKYCEIARNRIKAIPELLFS